MRSDKPSRNPCASQSGRPISPPARSEHKILAAFEIACQRDEPEVAAPLLARYEKAITQVPKSAASDWRHEIEVLICAHRRLWELLRSGISK